jgi:RNA polymerase primary sigma factor
MPRTDVADDGLLTYYSEIGFHGLLTAEQELALGAAARRGDRDARDRLVGANLRLVVKIARGFAGRGMPLDDLVAEGNLGLLRAAVEFEPGYGARFSTYASYWIKQAIQYALMNTAETIRLPAHMVVLLTKWRRAERALTRELGYPPTADRVADRLGLTEVQRDMVEKARRARRLRPDLHPADDDEPHAREPVDGGAPPEAQPEAEDERLSLLRMLEGLDLRERAVLTLRYGLGGVTPQTRVEIGRQFGSTREWVRKLEIRALAKLASSVEDPDAPRSPRWQSRECDARRDWRGGPAPARNLGRERPCTG